MKNIFLSMLLALPLVSCNAQKSFSKDALSEKLKAFDGSDTNLKTILEKHKGKVTVIEIWASWCGDCVKAMPKLKTLQANNPNVDYVFISMDKAEEKWKAGIEKHELKGDHYWANDEKMMKGAFGKAIDLDWIPRYIIIDAKGQIVTYRAIETDFDSMEKTLKTLQ
ncbi:TlpA family protein disulfide reductase [Flavobacterium pallidum]|uniref:Alkyl hydroperoxide reductase n=1 Tax=Flavobacterium pallidum TaxID=2172098 RepID=A0A2S1SIN5_9FLAO|nr:TlpA disulfide reductase family protein [Flavobacterium pallidum]AWI26245.1 alkyl hydroperoxide reductase [Flavobacterium pallidum]